MKNFKSGNKSRDRRDSSRRSFGGRDSRKPSLHDAVCDECGKDCQVPFRPSGGKPIYCSDCFEKKGGKGGRDDDGSSRRVFRRRNFDDRDSGRSSRNNLGDRSISQLVENIKTLNIKLDTIINLLSSAGEKKTELMKGKSEKNIKSKSTKADSLPRTEFKIEEKPRPVGKSKSKKEPQSDDATEPNNESSEDQNT